MNLLRKWFGRADANEVMLPLYRDIVEAARAPHWYLDGKVPDTVDGRFEMIAALLSLVLLRLEGDDTHAQQSVWLTELFVEDMDSQLRQIGVGDYVVGKHVGKLMGAFGGRMGAYRTAIAAQGDELGDTVVRNIYREESPDADALDHVVSGLRSRYIMLSEMPAERIFNGDVTL